MAKATTSVLDMILANKPVRTKPVELEELPDSVVDLVRTASADRGTELAMLPITTEDAYWEAADIYFTAAKRVGVSAIVRKVTRKNDETGADEWVGTAVTITSTRRGRQPGTRLNGHTPDTAGNEDNGAGSDSDNVSDMGSMDRGW